MGSHSYTQGYLRVSPLHELFYEGWGNPKGFPILFVHGGPGSGSGSPRYRKWFDPRKHNVIFFDQRGASRSRPFCETRENTTDHLVADMTKILNFFKVPKALLVGGSWGSTLALTYAIRNPHRVHGLFMRALFLGDRSSMNHYLRGGIRTHFPEAWDRFASQVPPAHRKDPGPYYYKKMRTGDTRTRKRLAHEWARYELSVLQLDNSEKTVKKYLKDLSFESLSMLEAHYITQDCFLPRNYILKNASKLGDMPVTLLHGRYDVICPPEQAWALKQAFPTLHLEFDIGGHVIPEESYNLRIKRGIAEILRKI